MKETDIDIISQLEDELDIHLDELSEVNRIRKGYSINSDDQITGLGLPDCEIFDINQIISLIEVLRNLKQLVLSDNDIEDISPLKNIRNLKQLVLSDNNIRDISPLKALRNLKQLVLSENEVSDISTLNKLKKLKLLSLSNNTIRDVSPLKTLRNLKQLILSENEVNDISTLSILTNLNHLYLSANEVTDITPLSTLRNLNHLYLSANKIRDISPLKTITNLTQLNLSENQISDITSLKVMTNLTQLNLSENQISDIAPLKLMMNLTQLNLSENQISDISALSTLTALKELNLSGNQLVDISPLSALKNLNRLSLKNNQISDISSLSFLTNLTQLDLSSNPIVDLPPWITDFNMEIQWNQYGSEHYITLFDIPLKTPPFEIVKKGKIAIRNYFAQIKEQQEDCLFEAKMLIVGEAGAGKTTLANKIQNPDYELVKNENSTEGIEVIRYEFPMENKKHFRINIWDFGGQEIYHATHQFFLTKRSLYALVADTRKEDTDFYYWLNVVELLSDNSPLLIIKNEIQDRQREIPERQLRGQFTNLKEILSTNFATKRGLPEILKEIQYRILSLPHIGSALPNTWVRVRETLEKDYRNHISLEQYLNICEKNGFTNLQDKLQLSEYLHDLGVCLHFQEDPLLKRIVILKPEWGTFAVYKVLDNKNVIRNFGTFTKLDLTEIWNDDRYEGMQDELLQLMLNFQLCYKIPGTRDTYIAPQLLTENQPDYQWSDTNNLILRYTYEFMPKGIMTRFIVVMNRYILNNKTVWKSGVILKKDDTISELIEYYGKREIKIRIVGKYKRDFMTIITHELDKIHDSYNRLKYSKMIPCNCIECKGSQNPHFYSFETLRRFQEKRQETIQCQNSFGMVNVRGLIDDIISEKSGNLKKKVFISYASEDHIIADKLYNNLTQKGIECWLDRKNLLAGQDWRKEIPNVIRKSHYVLLLISENSTLKTGYIQEEWRFIINFSKQFPPGRIFIIPVRLDNAKLCHEELKDFHQADLFSSYQKGLKQILRVIK